MSKRNAKLYDSKLSTPSKRAKLDITITPSQQAGQTVKKQTNKKEPDDLWGADFNDEDIEEMDFVASQASNTSVSVTNGTAAPVSSSYLNSKPSGSRSNCGNNSSQWKKFEPKIPSKLSLAKNDSSDRGKAGTSLAGSWKPAQASQMISSSSNNGKEMFKDEQSILFDDFKDNLLNVNNHNSTFQSQVGRNRMNGTNGTKSSVRGGSDAINISDDSILRQLEKLQFENQKLQYDCTTKEGEAQFLRNQLQQTVTRAEHDKIDKARQIEEQANQYRSEINQVIKKEESLRTQLEFQILQYNNLKERCKLLESGTVKFTQPHTARLDSSSKNRLNTTLNRSSSGVKTVQVTESGVQTGRFNIGSTFRLRKTVEIYPLSGMPQSIFQPSHVEPSVVEIQVIEKVGTKNLPILQDEENIRIFENPDLVKPIITMVNGQKLNVEFCSPDVATLMRKTRAEINAHNMIPVINKLVSVARELLLNTTLVLQRISKEMKNDDLRDMNDVYFSDFYKIHVDYSKSICDSNAWHDRERGIEAMRSLAILSYVTSASIYLSDYVSGNISLYLLNDPSHDNYIKDMNSYNKWPKKDSAYEMLELLLEFISTVGQVRRSHQFSGLIIAITRLLISVMERLVEDDMGIDYAFRIFKEIIFARPLLICYRHITELLMKFSRSPQFCNKLCVGTSKTAIAFWKDELHFTLDACVMQIYIAQLEFYQPDAVAMIDITYALVSFVLNILSLNNIAWIIHSGSACKCSIKLFGLTLNFLSKCSKVDLEEPVRRRNYDYVSSMKDTGNEFYLSNETSQAVTENKKRSSNKESSNSELLKKDVKLQSRHKQLLTLRRGIMFLCNLSTRDPDFIIRLSEIEDCFNLFMQQIESHSDLRLNDTEQAALSHVKSTFVFDKTVSSEERSDSSASGSAENFEVKVRPSGSNRQRIVNVYEDSASNSQRRSNNSLWLSRFISRKK